MINFSKLRNVRKWEPLAAGDIVDVVAPAWACSRQELNGALRFLRSLGLKPRVPKNIFAKVPMFAQTDENRFRQLSRALCAEDSKAVWCLRGGYGTLRLLPALARLRKPAKNKLFIGYSDITSLHTFLNAVWGWPTIHGPVLDRFGRGEHGVKETRELKRMIFGIAGHIEFVGLTPMNSAARKRRTVKGSVVGGNLATMQSSLGTPWDARPRSQIVFFEDQGERPHRLDRMLTQMKQAGYFDGVKAVVFGNFLFSSNKDKKLAFTDVLPRFAASVDFPVLKGVDVGHGKIQRPLPFLTSAELSLGPKSGSLVVDSGSL